MIRDVGANYNTTEITIMIVTISYFLQTENIFKSYIFSSFIHSVLPIDFTINIFTWQKYKLLTITTSKEIFDQILDRNL